MITAKTKICTIIGHPVEHSLSPQMHNAGYKALGIEDEFVFIALPVLPENLSKAVDGLRVSNVRGITVTVPHKVAVIDLLGEIDETAKKIGAVNTIVNTNGTLTGYNTDWIGIAEPLKKVINVQNKKVAILGAGGAAHAAIFAAQKLGGVITIYNRTLEHAKLLAEKLNCEYKTIDARELEQSDVIINTTSVGLEADESPIDVSLINNNQVIFDAVYKKNDTKFIQEAEKKGAIVINGTEMLLHQGLGQFELYTGRKAPEEAMRLAMNYEN